MCDTVFCLCVGGIEFCKSVKSAIFQQKCFTWNILQQFLSNLTKNQQNGKKTDTKMEEIRRVNSTQTLLPM